MSGSYLTDPLAFLIQTLFGLYILAVMLRFLLAWARADFYNPLSQFLVRITNPVLRPLRRVIPPVGGVDTASIILMLLLQLLSTALILALRGASAGLPELLLWSLKELVALLFNVFIFSILIQAILSWVNPMGHNPVASLLHSLNEPVLRPIRRVIPPISGMDLSPLVAIIGLQVLKMLIVPLLAAPL